MYNCLINILYLINRINTIIFKKVSKKYIKFSICSNFFYNNLKSTNNILLFTEIINPLIIINNLHLSICKDDLFKNNKFKLWNNCNSISTFNYIKTLIKLIITKIRILLFNLYLNIDNFCIVIKNIKYITISNTLIINIKQLDCIYDNKNLFKIKNIECKYNLNNFVLKCSISSIKINIIEKYVVGNLLDNVLNIINAFEKNDNNQSIYLNISRIIINLELQNYIKIQLDNLTLKEDIINIRNIICKVYRQNILWINDITFNLKSKIPKVYSIRLKLYKSTGFKINKSMIILKKKFIKLFKPNCKNEVTLNTPKHVNLNSNIDNNILNNIIDKFFIIKTQLIFYIKNICILIEPNKGKFIFKNIAYEQSDKAIYININSWNLSKNNFTYIKKTYECNDNFVIKYSSNSLEIFPYTIDIILDLNEYGIIFGQFINNINIILSLFQKKYVKQTYLFDKFHIQSFSTNFTYVSNKFSIDRFIIGNYSELINLVGITNLRLILTNNTVMYPKNWTNISQCILKKLILSLNNLNFKNVIDNKTVRPINRIIDINSNVSYFKDKAKNIIKNYNEY